MPAMMSTEAMRKRNHKISANRRYVMKVVLERYHGLGNDYVVFDPNKNELELNERNVRRICDRNAGLGSDGVLEGPILKEDGMYVKVWNPDGSESETSGNGVRIFAKYLKYTQSTIFSDVPRSYFFSPFCAVHIILLYACTLQM